VGSASAAEQVKHAPSNKAASKTPKRKAAAASVSGDGEGSGAVGGNGEPASYFMKPYAIA
jgi:hypothetical protein